MGAAATKETQTQSSSVESSIVIHSKYSNQSNWFSNTFHVSGSSKLSFIDVLFGIIFLYLLGLYLLHIVSLVYGKYRLHRRPKKSTVNQNLPGVSIIKPLVLPNVFVVNLDFRLNYKKFELLFCLNDSNDPAKSVVEALQERYPHIDLRIFVGGQNVGLNPKINNMMPGYKGAKYPVVLISDSRIYMHQDALVDMVECLMESPKIGLVTQLPYCLDRPGFGAKLEQVYFGGSHSRIYLASHALNFVCSTGMSSMFHRSILDECGGLETYSHYLAEDYFIGCSFNKRGLLNVVSHMPALQNASHTDARVFSDRICRWIKMRTSMLPHTMILEPIQESIISAIIGAFTVVHFFGWWWPVVPQFLIFHFTYWCLCDYLLAWTIQNGPLPFSPLQFLVCWASRELMAIPIFINAVLNPKISWRYGTYRLRWGGRIRND